MKDIAIPNERRRKYESLNEKLKKMWKVIPVMVEALGVALLS